ncbi:hypothetical protein BDV28DRAFT_143651 [Aspergillus coremiiformis]|uniref:Uncharacterized protein n=1 Tax=Aspergillus coremiiformis TaxID=138285 RepID=A0A5N6YTZ4_9EURO|nr:hypothetical protein BDV28DRAFT_143651 [Aspergillus coremiiformis]
MCHYNSILAAYACGMVDFFLIVGSKYLVNPHPNRNSADFTRSPCRAWQQQQRR